MAVSAYASLLSLTQVLNNVHNRVELCNIHADIKQIETLREGVNYLVGFLQIHHQNEDKRRNGLWRQISRIAFEAQEMFDLHVVNQLMERPAEQEDKRDFLALCEDLESVIQKIAHIKTKLPVVEEVRGYVLQVGRQPKASMSFGGKNVMVGFDEHRLHIMDELTKDKGGLKIIPITGMGGIGKTTLAKNVFEDPCIFDHFDMKIWLTISQKYNVHEILTGLLNEGVVGRGSSGDLESLGHNLYKKLFGRRYLIVMDDMWAIEAWYDFKIFFPNNGNGSRIMVTTRLENVASSLGSCDPYSISFLDGKTSWDLFCQTSFGQEDCPLPELKEIGMKIAKSCRGLPLAITAIGGLLANSNMTKEFWECVAENVSSLANSGYNEHCLGILLLSYNNLPIHLKPCFLYLRSYPEDRHIYVDELITRWVVEGYIKPEDGQSLEEIAMEYLKDLISRNLIFIHRWDRDVKSCGVHDLFRDLCLRESDKQCFIHLPIVQRIPGYCGDCFQCGQLVSNKGDIKLHNFVIFPVATCQGIFYFSSHGAVAASVDAGNIALSSQVSPSICGACKEMYSNLTEPRLVRIINKQFDHVDDRYYVHSTQSRHVTTREVYFIFPSLINLLWNLQILEFGRASNAVLPKGIWKLPEIRHIHIGTTFTGAAILPNPEDNDVEGKDFFVLKNLHTLSVIVNLKFTKNVLDRIPNLKTLSIRYQDEPEELVNHFLGSLSRLKTLKSLTLRNYMLESIVFPNSLKELVLVGCKFCWEDISTIGLLPYLEVLSLTKSGVGGEWAPVEGEFLQLRVLEIVYCDLVQWRANEMHFPRLEKLLLRALQCLEEIPLEIGDIDTLQTIELYKLGDSAINSAKQIWEEQQNNGNDSLQFHVYKDYSGTEPIQDWNV